MTPLYDTSHCPCEVCGEGDWMIYYDISHRARVHKAWTYTRCRLSIRPTSLLRSCAYMFKECIYSYAISTFVLLDFFVSEKAAPHECVIRTGQQKMNYSKVTVSQYV